MEAERPQREETGGGENAGAPSTEAAPSAPQQDAPSSKVPPPNTLPKADGGSRKQEDPIPEKGPPSPPKAPTGGSKDANLDLPVFVMCPKEELEARLRSAHKWHREAEKKTGSPLKERGVILSHLICDEVDQISDELVASYLNEMENLAKTDDDDKGEPPSFKWAEVKEGPWLEVKEGPWPFDAANILLCVALARYAAASRASREGGTQGLKVAFHSLKQIAGLLQYCFAILPKTAALRGDTAILAKVSLADASAITVAMAAASGRTHKLIASCAHHAALAAQWDDDEEDESPKKAKKTSCSHRKWSRYLAWKRQVHLALAWAHQGLHSLQLEEGGIARRCTGEGVEALSEGALFRDDYDALKPWRPHESHAPFDAAILKFVTDTDRKAERENAMVHFKSVPQDLPAALSSAVPDVGAIAPSGFLDAKETAIDIREEDEKCECSWKHVLIFPLLLILSLISAIVWVLLLPLKCIPCCCPMGTGLQVLWDTIEYFLRRPLKACL